MSLLENIVGSKLGGMVILKLMVRCFLLSLVLSVCVSQGQAATEEPKVQEMVRIHLEVGDRFLDIEQYREARRDYEKALSLDPNNLEILRKLVALYIRVPGNKDHFLSYDRADSTSHTFFNYLFRIFAIKPTLKNDVDLLMQEVQMLDPVYNRDAQELVLKKIHDLSPNDPDVLAELGYIQALITKDAKELKEKKGIELIKKAIQMESKILYHRYLADALRWSGKYTEAIQEYIGLIKRIKEGPPKGSNHKRVVLSRSATARQGVEAFRLSYDKEKKQFMLGMDLEKQASSLAFLLKIRLDRSSHYYIGGYASGTSFYPQKWLIRLYLDAEVYEKADETIREFYKGLGGKEEIDLYNITKEELELWIEVLTKGKHDPLKLAEVQEVYNDRFVD